MTTPRHRRIGTPLGTLCSKDRSSACCAPTASALNLTPRMFDALLVFVENAGALLDKSALLLTVWPGVVVEENNLSQAVFNLRRALGDNPHDSRYIQTVPRRGFRIVAEVRALAPHARAASPSCATMRATLAVLPFKPLVTEGRDPLLEMGMADSLIARLSTVPGLVVRSLGAVRRYGRCGSRSLASRARAGRPVGARRLIAAPRRPVAGDGTPAVGCRWRRCLERQLR